MTLCLAAVEPNEALGKQVPTPGGETNTQSKGLTETGNARPSDL